MVEMDTAFYLSPTDTGTDPVERDSDDDGYSDRWEVDLGRDPNDPGDTPLLPVPALDPWGQTLLLLALAGGAAGGLKLGRGRGCRVER